MPEKKKNSRAARLEDYGEVLTVDELSKVLNIGVTTLYRELKAGRIPSHKIGSSYRISNAALKDWLSKPYGVIDDG